MTTPKEALQFYADQKNWKGGSILDMEASHFDGWTKAQQALASFEGDAVERVAQTIREYCIGVSPASIQLSHGVERIYYAGLPVLELARAILNTGLVPDEAARPLSDVFNELVRRMNFDGMDPRTFTLGELERAIDGAEFPK